MKLNEFLRRPELPLTIAVCSCVLAIGCNKQPEEVSSVRVSVHAEHPARGPISQTIGADAILAPLSVAALTARINAPIRTEYVQLGEHVHRGELLLVLEDREIRGSALDSRGALASAQAAYTAAVDATVPEEVKKAELDVAQSKTAWEVANQAASEQQKLYKEGALSGHEADVAHAAAVQAQAIYGAARKHLQMVMQTTRRTTVEAAQGQLMSARGRLESAEAQVSYAELRSPIDGIITERTLFPGEMAQAGTPVITVMDTTSLLAKLHVAQATAQALRLGHAAQVFVPGMDGPLHASVSFISPVLDSGSATMEVWLKLPNPEGLLRVGSPVHVDITGRTVSDGLLIPASAILPGENGGTDVMVVASDGTVHRQAVTLGIRTTNDVQIISGLSSANTVVTEGGYGLDDGTKVTVDHAMHAQDGDKN